MLTLAVLQVGSEEERVQLGLGSVEEGGLLGGRNSVNVAEAETKETVQVALGGEGVGDGGGSLDGLAGDGQTTDGDGVLVDDTAGAGAITVGDGPGGAGEAGGGGGLGGVVDGLAVALAGRGGGREDPQVGGTGVEVEVKGLGRGSDLDGAQVLNIVLLGVGGDAASGTLDEAGRADVGDNGSEVGGERSLVLAVGLGEGEGTGADVAGVLDLLDGEASLLLGTGGEGGDGGGQGEAGREGRDEGRASHCEMTES